jgi:signal transduction histidine kinase/ActR/RegA family two-component response regulator
MGILSILFGCEKANKAQEVVVHGDTYEYLDRDFFEYIANISKSMLLCYLEGSGWVWANKTFLKSMNYHDIKDFLRENESIRDLFLNESEEIFTESDKSWLDYIKRYNEDGYRVTIVDKERVERIINAKVEVYSKNKRLYILKLEDVTPIYKAKQEVEASHKSRARFMASMSREFRTPMNGIVGFVDILRKSGLNEEQNEYVNMIENSSRALLQNIEILLDLTELNSGKLELAYNEFNLLPSLEKIVQEAYISAKQKGVKLCAFLDPKIPKNIDADSYRLSQVMKILLQTSIQNSTNGGKIFVEVKLLKRKVNDECSISFSVKDNGKGISKDELALIYDPFKASNKQQEHMSINMSLAHGLVELMGSRLRIETQENTGSTISFVANFLASGPSNFKMVTKRRVRVVLLDKKRIDEANFLSLYLRSFGIDVIKSNQLGEAPFDDVDGLYVLGSIEESSWILELGSSERKVPLCIVLRDDEQITPKLSEIVDKVIYTPLLTSKIAKHLYSIRTYATKSIDTESDFAIEDDMDILVVEDNLINQRLIEILLQEYGINVTTASNGLEAVRKSSKQSFDLIFMDIDMPQMNGIVATKEIKSRLRGSKTTPVVALTAMAMKGDREMLLEAGLDDYLAKPLTRKKLEYVLEKFLKVKV